jgi:Zn-dependent metalloprotease
VALSPKEEPLPADLPAHAQGSCCRPSLRARAALYDYFVDAHDGEVVFYFPSSRTLDVPTPMTGLDYDSLARQFFGVNGQGKFFLTDPIRNIETYDFNFQDLDANPQPPFPVQAISHSSHDLGTTSPQAVCAHHNAKLVFDFYNDDLKRDGIDDKGMKLVSVVNVYSSDRNPLPRPQFANWYPGRPNRLSTWRWEIGPGLGAGGGPIRNFANPAATGQPDHMNQYQPLPLNVDNGGVHIYSGIHNKAVHLLLTNTDGNGQLAFPTAELVLLLYLTLTRLTPTSVFTDSRRTLENVTSTFHAADAATRNARLAAIKAAFDQVGIV